MARPKRRTSKAKDGYRSGFEATIGEQLKSSGIDGEYEATTLKYSVSKLRSYKPDFRLPVKGKKRGKAKRVFIEVKGYFRPTDRTKALYVADSNPDVEVRFVFQNGSNKLSKKSKTTYGEWATKHGFKWAEKEIPSEWIKECA